jgi:hypothetical protein
MPVIISRVVFRVELPDALATVLEVFVLLISARVWDPLVHAFLCAEAQRACPSGLAILLVNAVIELNMCGGP